MTKSTFMRRAELMLEHFPEKIKDQRETIVRDLYLIRHIEDKAYFVLGKIHMVDLRIETAYAMFTEALKLHPEDPKVKDAFEACKKIKESPEYRLHPFVG